MSQPLIRYNPYGLTDTAVGLDAMDFPVEGIPAVRAPWHSLSPTLLRFFFSRVGRYFIHKQAQAMNIPMLLMLINKKKEKNDCATFLKHTSYTSEANLSVCRYSPGNYEQICWDDSYGLSRRDYAEAVHPQCIDGNVDMYSSRHAFWNNLRDRSCNTRESKVSFWDWPPF